MSRLNSKNIFLVILFSFPGLSSCNNSSGKLPSSEEVKQFIIRVNDYYQDTHPRHGRAFWDNAAYHSGNIAAYEVTGKNEYLEYSKSWAKRNEWKGARSEEKTEWKYHRYGESHDYVLFGDWQTCFQIYLDIYNLEGQKDRYMVDRAVEVMDYQVHTDTVDYWWWADALYMVMPVMVKMHTLTGEDIYLEKLYDYYSYAKNIMYDEESGLFFRDVKYIYPKHKSVNGLKDFWSRGNGWVFAALARIMDELPEDYEHTEDFREVFVKMAASIKDAQQEQGYWTRSILDPDHAPGPETSGTAFYTYGFLWGINQGILSEKEYLNTALSAWNYLSEFAVDETGKVGYVQPIGEKAIPGQVVDKNSTSNFGVGATLLAAKEMYNYTIKE